MAADALVLKVREAGRMVNVHALIAVAVNAEGYREILGIDVTTAEDGARWLTLLRSLTARGLSGYQRRARRTGGRYRRHLARSGLATIIRQHHWWHSGHRSSSPIPGPVGVPCRRRHAARPGQAAG